MIFTGAARFILSAVIFAVFSFTVGVATVYAFDNLEEMNISYVPEVPQIPEMPDWTAQVPKIPEMPDWTAQVPQEMPEVPEITETPAPETVYEPPYVPETPENPEVQQDVDDGWGHFYHEEGTTVVSKETTPGYTKEDISNIVLGTSTGNQNEIYDYLLDNFVMSDDCIKGEEQYKVKKGDIVYIERRTANVIEKLFCESGKDSLAVVEKVYQKKHYFGTTVTTAVVVDVNTGRKFETSLNGKLDPVYQVTQTDPDKETLRQQLGAY